MFSFRTSSVNFSSRPLDRLKDGTLLEERIDTGVRGGILIARRSCQKPRRSRNKMKTRVVIAGAVLLFCVSTGLLSFSLVTGQPTLRSFSDEKGKYYLGQAQGTPSETPTPSPTASPSPSPSATATPVPEPEPAPRPTPSPKVSA